MEKNTPTDYYAPLDKAFKTLADIERLLDTDQSPESSSRISRLLTSLNPFLDSPLNNNVDNYIVEHLRRRSALARQRLSTYNHGRTPEITCVTPPQSIRTLPKNMTNSVYNDARSIQDLSTSAPNPRVDTILETAPPKNSHPRFKNIMKGYLRKKGEGGFYRLWRRRYFRIIGNLLSYYYYDEENEKPINSINLAQVIKVHIVEGHLFDIHTTGRIWHLKAENKTLAQKWVKALESQVRNLSKEPPANAPLRESDFVAIGEADTSADLDSESDDLRMHNTLSGRYDELTLLREENILLRQEINTLKKAVAHLNVPFHEVELDLENRLGAGGYGEVYRALWHGQKVAIKIFKTYTQSDSSSSILNELQTYMRLRHKHIVLLMGTTMPNKQEIMLVMEYMKNGSLEDLLFPQYQPPVKLQHHQIIQIALDVAKGLNYLHCLTPKIIHRDLKCANILLYHNSSRAKLSDFGTARFLNPNSVACSNHGTIGYMAPEVLEEEEYDEKADLFSFGMVLLVLVTSEKPPLAGDPVKLAEKIESKLNNTDQILAKDETYKKLIYRCCQVMPNYRPSVKECIHALKALRHKYNLIDTKPLTKK